MLMDKIRPYVPQLKNWAILAGLWLYKQLNRKVSYKVVAAAVTVDVAIIVTGVVTFHVGTVILVMGGLVAVTFAAQLWANWADTWVSQVAEQMVREANRGWAHIMSNQTLIAHVVSV